MLVAFHDDRLDRVTDRAGAIGELGIEEVEAADAGYTFSQDGGSSFPFRGGGIRVPRLEELLVRWSDVRVNIDPKADACVAPLAALLDRLGAWERVCIGSFSDRRLRRIRALGHGRGCTSMGPRAVVLARFAAASGVMPRFGADCIQVPIRRGPVTIVTKRFIDAAHRPGLRHPDLASHPGAGMLDRLTRPRVLGPSRLEEVKDVLRARCRPKREEMVIRIGEDPTAADRHEARVPDLREDHGSRSLWLHPPSTQLGACATRHVPSRACKPDTRSRKLVGETECATGRPGQGTPYRGEGAQQLGRLVEQVGVMTKGPL